MLTPHWNLADNPRRTLGAEADFDQLLFKILNGIGIQGDGIVVRIGSGSGLRLVAHRLRFPRLLGNGCDRHADNRAVILLVVILTLVGFECDPAPLNLVLIDRLPLAHVPLLDQAALPLYFSIVAHHSRTLGAVPDKLPI